jgi:hypothetical protein|tara:strand:- start:5430 stop:5690 length:261 start_codon:yes stop_codon:yes gene_type:complete
MQLSPETFERVMREEGIDVVGPQYGANRNHLWAVEKLVAGKWVVMEESVATSSDDAQKKFREIISNDGDDRRLRMAVYSSVPTNGS